MLWGPSPDRTTVAVQFPPVPTVAVPRAVGLSLSYKKTVLPTPTASVTVPEIVWSVWFVKPPLLVICTTGLVVLHRDGEARGAVMVRAVGRGLGDCVLPKAESLPRLNDVVPLIEHARDVAIDSVRCRRREGPRRPRRAGRLNRLIALTRNSWRRRVLHRDGEARGADIVRAVGRRLGGRVLPQAERLPRLSSGDRRVGHDRA